MPNKPTPIKQSEITRYAKALNAADVESWRLIIRPDGEHEIVVNASDIQADLGKNDWD